MAETTKIEWASHTWNPYIGCSKVSAGCANCYAEADFDKRRGFAKWGPNGTRVKTSDAYWKKPVKWNREAACTCGGDGEHCAACLNGPPRVFVSLCDPFEDWDGPIRDHRGNTLDVILDVAYIVRGASRVTGDRPATINDLRRDLFRLIDATPNLNWILCTKRPENIHRMWCDQGPTGTYRRYKGAAGPAYFRDNVWLLTSVENQETADARIPHLLKCHDLVPVLGLSCEPLIGPIDLLSVFDRWCAATGTCTASIPRLCDWLAWCIIGGESGRNARACDLAWIRSLRDQGQAAGVATFVKQCGSNMRWAPRLGPCGSWPDDTRFDYERRGDDSSHRILLRHPKGGDPGEWPTDLRVREVPT